MKHDLYAYLRAALVCAGAAALLLAAACGAQTEEQSAFGLFSWDSEVTSVEEADDLERCMDRCGVTSVYQEFDRESLETGEASGFVSRMGRKAVKVYALMGQAEWAYEENGDSLIGRIKTVAAYNKQQPDKARLAGVMVDVEPYLLDEWDEGEDARRELMEGYLSCVKSAYACASQNGLEFWACIPTFYDSTNVDILEQLIAGGCTGVAVMNYNRTDEYMQMAKEVGYAREYGKGVVCIYELQEPGKHDLEEINTYANAGLDALWDSACRLDRQFGYQRLEFAYHYYKPLKKLLG